MALASKKTRIVGGLMEDGGGVMEPRGGTFEVANVSGELGTVMFVFE